MCVCLVWSLARTHQQKKKIVPDPEYYGHLDFKSPLSICTYIIHSPCLGCIKPLSLIIKCLDICFPYHFSCSEYFFPSWSEYWFFGTDIWCFGDLLKWWQMLFLTRWNVKKFWEGVSLTYWGKKSNRTKWEHIWLSFINPFMDLHCCVSVMLCIKHSLSDHGASVLENKKIWTWTRASLSWELQCGLALGFIQVKFTIYPLTTTTQSTPWSCNVC